MSCLPSQFYVGGILAAIRLGELWFLAIGCHINHSNGIADIVVHPSIYYILIWDFVIVYRSLF